MTVTAPPAAPSPMPGLAPSAVPIRWSREEFLNLAESGVFGERQFELLDGELYEIMAQSHPHRSVTMLIVEAMRAAFGQGYLVRCDLDLPMGRSQPIPDVSVLRGTARDFVRREEGPEDAALLVEVVATRPDTAALKVALYAQAGIAEYWILDIESGTLTAFREPDEGGYRAYRIYGREARVIPLEPGAGEIAVADLLP